MTDEQKKREKAKAELEAKKRREREEEESSTVGKINFAPHLDIASGEFCMHPNIGLAPGIGIDLFGGG